MNINNKIKFSENELTVVKLIVGKEIKLYSESTDDFYSEFMKKRLETVINKTESNLLHKLDVSISYDLIRVLESYNPEIKSIIDCFVLNTKDRLISKIRKNINIQDGNFILDDTELFDLKLTERQLGSVYGLIVSLDETEIDTLDSYYDIKKFDIKEVNKLLSTFVECNQFHDNMFHFNLHELDIITVILHNYEGNDRVIDKIFDIYTDIILYRNFDTNNDNINSWIRNGKIKCDK